MKPCTYASLFLAALLTTLSAQTYTFSTLAGDAGYGSTDGPANLARFNNPVGVAVDANGIVFVTDSNNSTIRKITPAGTVTTWAGAAGFLGSVDGTGSAARFYNPGGLAIDATGNLYVCDNYNRTIRKITANGVVTTLAGAAGILGSADGAGGTARFNGPNGIAVDANGNVFVTDFPAHTIRKITAAGVVSTFAGVAGISGREDGTGSAARFNNPAGVAVDGDGNVFVTDFGNHTIRKITAAGVVTTFAGAAGSTGSADGTGNDARFNAPNHLAVDRNGSVFVADSNNNTLRKITAERVVTTLAGAAGSAGVADGIGSAAQFGRPTGVAVDAIGNVFVTDYYNNTIRKVSPGGAVTTLAGVAGSIGSVDGNRGLARFNAPSFTAVDPSGRVVIADPGNHTIREISSQGVVSTLAGLAGTFGTADGSGSAARFNQPAGVGFDRDGNVVVADSGNHVIRKITAGGVVTTLAGLAGSPGSVDGVGSAARLRFPFGVAVDRTGNVYVGDSNNHTIRKITPEGVITTLAGTAGSFGNADGVGGAARFNFPAGVAVDASGNVYVADYASSTVRKISAGGLVTTLAGSAGLAGGVDGTGSAARFNGPYGIAVDASGNVFVGDTGNHAIRQISTSGTVTTVGGIALVSGSDDGVGRAARFYFPQGVAVGLNGDLFIGDSRNNTIRRGVPDFVATVAIAAPSSQHVNLGTQATLVAAAAGRALRYQWKKDGVAIPGATSATYTTAPTLASDMGFYSFVVTGADGAFESAAGILTVATDGTSRLANLSTRGLVTVGGDLTVGFVMRGSGGKSLLVRAVGPTLSGFGVGGALADPKLDVIAAGAANAIGSNDDWAGTSTLAEAFTAAGAFALPAAAKDAALLATLPAAGYSVRITSSVAGGSGIAIAEVYDRDAPAVTTRLVNISTLGFVGVGPEALVPGFVIGGDAPKQLLIRAVGPGLASFGVSGALADPQLAITPLGKTFTVATNDNWGGGAPLAASFVSAGAFALAGSSRDAALVVRLPPGGYTVTVSGIGNTTGRALVEIYDLDP